MVFRASGQSVVFLGWPSLGKPQVGPGASGKARWLAVESHTGSFLGHRWGQLPALLPDLM